MSDFGFDTGALAGGDAAAPSHPLTIARELIAGGQPREALAVLSEHHDVLVDDPEYLLACSEAWWAEGDALRAQQALLGAARLVPDDPTPLVLLAELLRQEGEDEKAERVLAKAESLGEGPRVSSPGEPIADAGSYEDDLIAAAELEERRTRAGLTPKQIAMAVAALLVVSGVLGGIVHLTRTPSEPAAVADEAAVVARGAAAVPQIVEEVGRDAAEEVERPPFLAERVESVLAESAPVGSNPEPSDAAAPTPVAETELPSEPVGPSEATRPIAAVETVAPVLPTVPEVAKRAPTHAAKKTARAKPARTKPARAKPVLEKAPEPEPLLPLTDTEPGALTRQADTLHAQGQTGLAAAYYRRALEVDPDYAPALVGIGRSLLRAEKYGESFTNATRALELARGVDSRPGLEAEAIYQLGRVHLHRGDLDAARRLFRQASSLPRAPSEVWFYLGEALWNDNSPAARIAYETYLERVPEGPLAERARKAIQ